mmetsp:Transcript_108845/g.242934  ORF Transcript_108845/g.242934 Transcript_108845/m.242934 type:complete len:82 (+) Transcript_108845:123-368(+)
MIKPAQIERTAKPAKKAPRPPSTQSVAAAPNMPRRGDSASRVRMASLGWLTKVAITPAMAPDISDTNNPDRLLRVNVGKRR